MRYQQIKIGELESFIQSDLYKNSKNIPITQQRALSQLKNPRANQEDVALIIAVDNNKQIVGFIGALPEKLPKHPELKLAWNSCWWIDQKTGKGTAMPLFLHFLKSYQKQVMFRDLTNKTEQILMRLNQFEKIKKLQGNRYFLHLNSKDILVKKNKNFKLISPVLKIIDKAVNTILKVQNRSFLNKKSLKSVKIDYIDQQAENFIKEHQKKELFKRDKTELNWIIKQPWILHKSIKNPNQFYYFSDTSKYFLNTIFKLYNSENQIIALLFFTNNRGLVKVPYIYFDKRYLSKICDFIFWYLIKEKANSVLIFNSALNQEIKKKHNPFWYRKEINKDFVVSKKIIPYLPKEFDFQDGEGDFVFT